MDAFRCARAAYIRYVCIWYVDMCSILFIVLIQQIHVFNISIAKTEKAKTFGYIPYSTCRCRLAKWQNALVKLDLQMGRPCKIRVHVQVWARYV